MHSDAAVEEPFDCERLFVEKCLIDTKSSWIVSFAGRCEVCMDSVERLLY